MNNTFLINDLINHSHVNITESETRIIGIIIFVEILFCYIPYCIILAIFIRSPHFNKLIAYQIMVGVGITDLVGLTGWGIMSVMMIFNERFGFIFGKITGALAHTGWQGMVLFSVVLAVNRSDAIIEFLPFVEGVKNRLWKIIYIITYFLIALLFISNLSPNMGVIMDHLTVHYEPYRIQFHLESINDNTALALFGICCIFYVISFVCLIIKAFKGSFKFSLDTLLFIQTIFITMFKCFIVILWTYYSPSNNLILVICMFLNILEPGYHPYMYLIFNKRLRKEFRRIFSSKGMTTGTGLMVS